MRDINDLTPVELERAFYEAKCKLNDAREELKRRKATFVSLNGWKKEFFAKLCKESTEKTEAAKAREVRCSERWHKYKRGLLMAENKFDEARCEVIKLEATWETARTIISDRRVARMTNT